MHIRCVPITNLEQIHCTTCNIVASQVSSMGYIMHCCTLLPNQKKIVVVLHSCFLLVIGISGTKETTQTSPLVKTAVEFANIYCIRIFLKKLFPSHTKRTNSFSKKAKSFFELCIYLFECDILKCTVLRLFTLGIIFLM